MHFNVLRIYALIFVFFIPQFFWIAVHRKEASQTLEQWEEASGPPDPRFLLRLDLCILACVLGIYTARNFCSIHSTVKSNCLETLVVPPLHLFPLPNSTDFWVLELLHCSSCWATVLCPTLSSTGTFLNEWLTPPMMIESETLCGVGSWDFNMHTGLISLHLGWLERNRTFISQLLFPSLGPIVPVHISFPPCWDQ